MTRHPARRGPAARRQRGVATLVVVLVLFFIVSMVAAYTSRNLIFEQRTSSNQLRSTQALEAAEAGVEWALAMLNHQRITDSCNNSTVSTDGSYRDRYLVTDWTKGNFTPRTKSDGVTVLSQSCVFNGSTWNCSCPTGDADPLPAVPVGSDVYPAFHVRLEEIGAFPPVGAPTQPGVIRLHVIGCTRLDATCLDFSGQGISHEGRAAIRVLAALTGNAVAPPTAALLAHNNLTLSGAATVANTDPAGSGITLHAGGTINAPSTNVYTTPGSLAADSLIASDAALALPALTGLMPISTDDRFFASIFNLTAATFQQQPAAVVLPCSGGTCTAADVHNAIALNPGRPLWLQGDLVVDSAGDIGTANVPVLLVVNGNVQFTVGGVTIYGLTYLRTATWTVDGSGTFDGAVVAQGDVTGASTATPVVIRDAAVLQRLRYGSGSFVRLSGSWRDFE